MELDLSSKQKAARVDRRMMIKLAGAGVAAKFAGSASLGVASSRAADDAPATPAIAPLQTEFVFEAQVTLEPAVQIGPSSDGVRRYIPITGGTFVGPRIKGVVLSGGADWQVDRADGVTTLDALYSIKTDDGAVIVVRNRGLIADRGSYLRTIPQFEAPIGRHDWLNKSVFVGSVTRAPRPGEVIIRVFRIL